MRNSELPIKGFNPVPSTSQEVSTPISPLDSPTESFSPLRSGSSTADDTASLKSWFETGLTSASKFAQKFTFPILGRPKDAEELEPRYDVFLGGSCGHTVWRAELVIPYLKKRAISYYDPQRPAWSENMIYEEALAKESSRLFLFVLDPGTINATSFLEIAYFAARRAPKLVVVFLGKREWSDKAHPMDLPDRIRTCNLLEAILKRHSVPMMTCINEALDYIDEMIIGSKPMTKAMSEPLQRVPYMKLKTKAALQSTSRAVHDTLQSTSRAVHDSFDYFKSKMASITIKAVLLILLEIAFIVSFHIFVIPQFPIWILIVPFLAVDYLIVLAAIFYFRYKARKRKQKISRKVVLPSPPIPRIGKTNVADHTPKQSASKEALPTNNIAIYDQINLVDSEVRTHFKEQLELRPSANPKSKAEKIQLNGCVTSPVGYDVFLSCSSSSELDWITQKAVPQLHKSGLTYTSAIMCDREMRIPMLHTASHILYYIPSYKTFLSGMIEIAYFIGHSDWQVTVCVPREAECLALLDDSKYDPETVAAVERRNASYRMAFCYLKDMAQRRQCRVFTKVEEAIKYIGEESKRDTEHKAILRQIVEKQHLVKEKTKDLLLNSPIGSQSSGIVQSLTFSFQQALQFCYLVQKAGIFSKVIPLFVSSKKFE
uniref:Uncharacterized protein n=1 Tax=Panagrolaimus sp. JU765 TaxID=591449 RepID=A0AC34QTD2_9BILA